MAAESPYGVKLSDAITRSGKSVRKVAQLLAARTGNKLEDERSAIYRYKKDQEPSSDRAFHLAVILEAPELATVTPIGERRATRVAALAGEVDDLKQALTDARLAHEALLERVSKLEKAAARGRRQASG